MKKKILLVPPGWYPSIENPVLGIFFKEQMQLLNSEFEFKVLLGNCTEISRKNAMMNLLKRKRLYNITRIDNKYDQDHEQIIALNYEWVKLLPEKFEQYQYNFYYKYFESILLELKKSGWWPDLIHIQTLSGTAVYISEIANKRNIPTILTEHCEYPFENLDFWHKKKKELYTNVNKVLCVSHDLLRHLLIHNCTFKEFAIIGNYVHDENIYLTTYKKDNINIAFVAIHPHMKDFNVLIDSIKHLSQKLSNFKVNIFGMNEKNGFGYALKQDIIKANLEEYFCFKGQMPKNEIYKNFQENKLLISTSHCETFGLAVAEAIINGLPVVCTDSGGIREFVNQTNGIIVPIREPLDVANAVLEVLNNLDSYNRIEMSNTIINKYGKKAFSKSLVHEYLNQINTSKIKSN